MWGSKSNNTFLASYVLPDNVHLCAITFNAGLPYLDNTRPWVRSQCESRPCFPRLRP